MLQLLPLLALAALALGWELLGGSLIATAVVHVSVVGLAAAVGGGAAPGILAASAAGAAALGAALTARLERAARPTVLRALVATLAMPCVSTLAEASARLVNSNAEGGSSDTTSALALALAGTPLTAPLAALAGAPAVAFAATWLTSALATCAGALVRRRVARQRCEAALAVVFCVALAAQLSAAVTGGRPPPLAARRVARVAAVTCEPTQGAADLLQRAFFGEAVVESGTVLDDAQAEDAAKAAAARAAQAAAAAVSARAEMFAAVEAVAAAQRAADRLAEESESGVGSDGGAIRTALEAVDAAAARASAASTAAEAARERADDARDAEERAYRALDVGRAVRPFMPGELTSAEEMISIEPDLAEQERRLMVRTWREMQAGAELVVWPELALPVMGGANETALLDRAAAFLADVALDLAAQRSAEDPAAEAARAGVPMLAMAIGAIYRGASGRAAVMNKVLLLSPAVPEPLLVAAKRYPSPGAAAEAQAMAVDEDAEHDVVPVALTGLGTVAVLIGTDLEVDTRARQAALAGADLVLSPAADLLGREPAPTDAAALRAAELGVALVRHSTTGVGGSGLSSAFDAHGRRVALADVGAMAADHGREGAAMVAHLPLGGVDTAARRWGGAAAQALHAGALLTLLALLGTVMLY